MSVTTAHTRLSGLGCNDVGPVGSKRVGWCEAKCITEVEDVEVARRQRLRGKLGLAHLRLGAMDGGRPIRGRGQLLVFLVRRFDTFLHTPWCYTRVGVFFERWRISRRPRERDNVCNRLREGYGVKKLQCIP